MDHEQESDRSCRTPLLGDSQGQKVGVVRHLHGFNSRFLSVPVVIKGGPTEAEVKSKPKHKKNPDVGEKQTVYSSNIVIEQEDAVSFEDQEEVSGFGRCVLL